MDMQGSRQLAITQQQAWDALNDPAVLKTCIPGCDKVEASGENQFSIGMALKIGPVAAKFAGKITLSDIAPPNSYTISFEGQGGPAGFGKGNAKVQLTSNERGCELSYNVQASVGGKIAQMGQRLIDGVAKSMAEDFFKRFDDEMQKQHPGAYAAQAVADSLAGGGAPTEAASAGASGGMPTWVWAVGAAVVVIAAIALLR
ncbi:MAG: carbon monoxide dehydrogenase [Betaproteobacteria bacterium]|nr:carbon monoxide dehydrogenase [Betaproteobacteria bacterium]